jgi:hypothetical protein
MGHCGCVSLLLDHGADINSAGMSRIVLQIKTIELVPLKITVSKFGIDMLEAFWNSAHNIIDNHNTFDQEIYGVCQLANCANASVVQFQETSRVNT